MRRNALITLIAIAILLSSGISEGGNILKDLFKIYTTYEEVNMLLWLTGDIKAEKRFGKEIKWFINLTNRKVKDPETNRWVSSVFDRVKAQYRDRGLDYNITVLEGGTVNAFAIPGGNIFIYKGMLDFVGSDDELAAILGHELAHSERRHSLKQLRNSVAFQILMEKAIRNKEDRETWGALVGALTMLKFSREDEAEADDIGQRKMFQSGFDPSAQVLVWEKFVQKFGKGEKGILQYLSSHPPSQERAEKARKNLVEIGGGIQEKKDFTLSFNILSDVQENLIQNGSFETDLGKKGFPDAWTIREGKANLETLSAVTGKNALRLLCENNIRPTRVVSEFIPVSASEKYMVTGYLKTESTGQRVNVGAEAYDQNKKLRGHIWPFSFPTQTPPGWSKFVGAFEFGPKQGRNLPPECRFIRVILQNGPLAKGEIDFDHLIMRRGSFVPPRNYLENGGFEIDAGNGLPLLMTGSPGLFIRDTQKFKVGYASLKLSSRPNAETEVEFSPIPVSVLKEGSLEGSFHFVGSGEIKGRILLLLQDDAGNTLSRRILDKEFTAKPDLWQATGFKSEFRLNDEEKKIVKSLSLRITATIPASGNLWFDEFVLR